MLSCIGRAAIRRAGTGASHRSTNRALQSIWHLQRVDKSNNVALTSALRQFSFYLRRSYATTTQATKPKTKTSATKPRPTTKRAAPKKQVKKAVKRVTKKKAAAKPKPKAKPKKKPLTEDQKQKLQLKALKATALAPPKGKPSTAWLVVFTEMMQKGSGGIAAPSIAREAAVKYKSLTTEELEHYNHVANQNKTENETEYKKWINTYKPEEIRLANNARNLLRKKQSPQKKGSSKYQLLQDPRIPKQPRRAWTLFAHERWNSGDFKGINVGDGTRLVLKEWRDLSPSQRKSYEDSEADEKRRYVQEYKTVFGRDPQFIRDQAKAAA